MKNVMLFTCLTLCCFFSMADVSAQAKQVIQVRADGAKRLQQFDGIGVNANSRSWNEKELEPAIHLLLDSMNLTIWRVVVETVEKWEETNDDNDPFHYNWDYYNKLYETPKFRKAWDMIAYLNKLGVSKNLVINFMGPVPEWMGKKVVNPAFEDEYLEMVASFFYYAKVTKGLKFTLIAPTNESDWGHNEGPEFFNENDHVRIHRKLIARLDALGLTDLRFVAPDPANMNNGVQRYLPAFMKDSLVMSRIAHWGLHSYGGYYANPDSLIKQSSYPGLHFWITEWNAWRDGLDDGKIGVYDYAFAAQSVSHLLDLLRNGASAAIAWEGYDSYYEHHAPSLFSYWGILAYDQVKKTYTPRKHMYAIAQVSKAITPGSWHIETTGSTDSVTVVAFFDPVSKRVSITGINKSVHPVQLKGALANLPAVRKFNFSYTSSAENLRKLKDVKIASGTFQAAIPAKSIFSMTGIAE